MTDESLELTRKRLAHLFAEDRYNKRELSRPSFTVAELAKMTGTPKSTISSWVMEAGLGRYTTRDGRGCRVLTLDEIEELRREFGWMPVK